MTTYLLSHFGGCWHIHRYDDEVSLIASNLSNEREAIEIAMSVARVDRPSRVMKTTHLGESTVVRVFEADSQTETKAIQAAPIPALDGGPKFRNGAKATNLTLSRTSDTHDSITG